MPNDLETSEQSANTRIKKLSPLLINQLAAGEVVTRPAAVVKELLENAIDAKATAIEIHITQGGMGIIQVVDNGVGIHSDDMVMAITRHATSKVADIANLHGISTLGFRGEALAATAAVSRLTLISSDDDSGIGRQLQVAGVLAQQPKLTPVLHSRGTTVTIKDLYFNVPARRGNLKSIATEFAHIETIVREVALARADVTLTLFHDNKKRLMLSANTKEDASFSNASVSNASGSQNQNLLPITRLEQALGLPLTENSVELTIDLSSLLTQLLAANLQQHSSQQALISGWLWPSAQLQPNLPKLLYVNGRLIKEPIISNQLRQLAASSDIKAMGYALHFELPLHWLNVNVHPSKQRIKISPLNNIMAHLSHAITNKLKSVVLDIPPIMSLYSQPSDNHKANDRNNNNNGESANNAEQNSLNPSNRILQTSSVKQTYQHSNFSLLASNSLAVKQDQSFRDNSFTTQSANDKSFEQADKKLIDTHYDQAILAALPFCLEVIDDLSALDSLPCLLFYSQGQLTIIKQSDWLQRFASIFANNDYCQDLKKSSDLLTSQQVNQQIRRYATQMSTADLQAFITDMNAILASNAKAQIESKPLINLMLSSTLTQ